MNISELSDAPEMCDICCMYSVKNIVPYMFSLDNWMIDLYCPLCLHNLSCFPIHFKELQKREITGKYRVTPH